MMQLARYLKSRPRIIAIVAALAQLTACNGPGQLDIPSASGISPMPILDGGSIPSLGTLLPPNLGGNPAPYTQSPAPQPQGAAQLAVEQALEPVVESILRDDMPINLDASTAFPTVEAPPNFSPTPIDCTPSNINMPLSPGDYTCQVFLYCMKDSIHRTGVGVPYELGPLEGAQAEAIGTFLARGTLAHIPPTELQTISWEIQAAIPLNGMPLLHQLIIRRLIPEYVQGLEGDYLERVTSAYSQLRYIPGMRPLDMVLAGMGEPGKAILDIINDRETLKENALNYQQLNEQVYDNQDGTPQIFTPSEPSPSPWSQIRPGVVGQLTIESGNLGFNTLNFRVLSPSSASMTVGQLFFGNSSVGTSAASEPSVGKPASDAGDFLIGYSIQYATQALYMTVAVAGPQPAAATLVLQLPLNAENQN